MECFWNECPSFDKSPPAELGSNFSHSFPNSFPFWCIDSYLCPSLICAPSSQKWPFQWKKQHGFASSLHIRAVQSINPFHLGQGFNLRKYPKKKRKQHTWQLVFTDRLRSQPTNQLVSRIFPPRYDKVMVFHIYGSYIGSKWSCIPKKCPIERTWNNIGIQSQGLPLDYFSNLYFFHNPSPAPPPKKKKKKTDGVSVYPNRLMTKVRQEISTFLAWRCRSFLLAVRDVHHSKSHPFLVGC